MRESQTDNLNEKKSFVILRETWDPGAQLPPGFSKDNQKDIDVVRQETIKHIKSYKQNESFVKDYLEIEKKINENSDNAKLNEIYLGEIIQLCQMKNKSKRLEIIDDLKICLEKCSDKEILDFLQSINDENEPKSNENVTELKTIWENYKEKIKIYDSNPEIEKILQLDFVLNVIDAVKDENIKLELKRVANPESDNFLNEVTNYAENLASPLLDITEDNDDSLGLRKLFSEVGEALKPLSNLISRFITREAKDLELVINTLVIDTSTKNNLPKKRKVAPDGQDRAGLSLTDEEILQILKNQDLLRKKFIAGTFTQDDKSELLSVEKLNEHIKVLSLDYESIGPHDNLDFCMENHKLIYAVVNKDLKLAINALQNGADSRVANLESIILDNDDSFASEMINILNVYSLASSQLDGDFWNKQYRGGNTALHLALLNDKTETVKALLVTLCIDPKIRNDQWKTVSDLKNDDVFEELLRVLSISQKNSPNQRLILAIKDKNYDEVDQALEDGANIYNSYKNIDIKVARLKGGDPFPDPHEGLTIYDFAKALYGENADEVSKKILEKLSKNQTHDQDLISAITRNDIAKAQEAINNGANINCKVPITDDPKQHFGLFYYACFIAKAENDYGIVNLLLKNNVNYFDKEDLEDDSGISKMIADLRKNNCEIKSFLNQQNEEGNTPLHLACIGNKTQTAKQLIEAGADSTIENNQNKQAKDLTENLELKSFLSNELLMRVKSSFLSLRLPRPDSSEPNPTLSPNKSDDSLFEPINPLR